MNPINTPDQPSGSSTARLIGGVILTAIVCGLVIIAFRSTGIGTHITEFLLAQLERLQQARDEYPVAVYAGAFLLYVALAGLSLPGAALLTLAFGWMFGFWRAMILVSFSSTAGATVAFLLSRYLLRDVIQTRFGSRLTAFNEALRREGAFYLFSLRLIPAVPFFVINAGMGLTPISVGTFWWVSQLGMLPGTAVYVYAGTSLPGLEELKNPSVTKLLSPQLLIAFTLLGLFPLVIKKVMQRFSKKTDATTVK